MKGYEDYLVKSSLFEMFLCKEGIDEREETGADDGCSKDTTHVSNLSMLEEDLECSSSDENDDNDDDDSDSDTSSSDEEKEHENNDKTGKDFEKNNNDDDPSITISSDSEDDKSKVAVTPKKKEIVGSQRYKLFYEDYEGTGKRRKVRCKLCPGNHILTFSNFHWHIKYVHENHGRQTCNFCHKDYAFSFIKAHIKTCQKLNNMKSK